jgi:hypothetical protein
MLNVHRLAVTGGSNLFLIAQEGVFLSTDNGLHWTTSTDGQPREACPYSLAVQDTTLFLGLYWAGVMKHGWLGKPPIPLLNAPADQMAEQTIPAVLSWFPTATASSYRLQVASDARFSNTVYLNASISGCSQTITQLTNNQTYFWRVRASNIQGSGAWSPVRSFTTTAPPVSPTLLSPSNYSINQPDSLVCSWQTVVTALSYHFQGSSDSSFKTNLVENTGLTDTQYTVNGLSGHTDYFWRVRATDGAGSGSWSSVFQFTTANHAPSLSFAFDSILADFNGLAAFTVRVIEPDQEDSIYLWSTNGLTTQVLNTGTSFRVSADSAGYDTIRLFVSDGRDTAEYTLGVYRKPKIAVEDALIPSTTFCEAVEPNPFNPATTLRFGLAHPAEILVEVYDTKGRKMATLAQGHRAAGRHHLVWNCGAVPSGWYLISVRIGQYKRLIKALLIK